ncbi:MAG: hypothetical protein NVSMB22_11310 [Chloroflexota bacterium]
MPFFRHRSEEQQHDEEAQRERRARTLADQQASMDSLAAGGIPIPAQRRLDELRARERPFFTSDLTVNEFLLSSHAAFTPLTQVMGSSIYHVGWQRTPGTGFTAFLASQSQELSVVSQAMNHARALALGRLSEEAQRVGANAVIGVHVTRSEYEWARDMIEFSAVGTAVRWKHSAPSERPVLTNLSGQDFWKLHQSGYAPQGVVASSTVFYVVGGWTAQMANNSFFASRRNMEIVEFSQGVSLARHRAMGLILEQARHMASEGIVGTAIEQRQEEHKVDLGNDQERTDLICRFDIIGTAITSRDDAPSALSFAPVVPLSD